MSVNITALPLRLKRVDCEDPHNNYTLKCKRRRLSQPPSPGLAPCLRPQTHSTEHTGPEKLCVSSIGPYILLEATEGTHTYRAIHRITEQEHTCKVSSLTFNIILGIAVFQTVSIVYCFLCGAIITFVFSLLGVFDEEVPWAHCSVHPSAAPWEHL